MSAAWWFVAVLAQSEPPVVDPRDEAIFGEPPTAPESSPAVQPPPPAQEPATSREAEVFGGGEDATRSRLLEDLAERNERLSLGGQLYLRFEYAYTQDADWRELPLKNPTLLDVYLDARPTERLRTYARGRLRHDVTLHSDSTALPVQLPTTLGTARRDESTVILDQLWLKYDIAELAFVTLGRQPVRWGSGRFWNPTDFLNPRVRDPLAVFDERNGVGLARLHIPIESLGWNFYAVANLEGAATLRDVGGALRAEFLLAQTEIALSYADRRGEPLQLGADISSALGWFDIRLEVAARRGDTQPFYRGNLALDYNTLTFELPETYSRAEDWLVQGTAGAEIQLPYGDGDNLLLGAEYFFNDAGYPGASLYPALFFSGTFTPLYTGRHYAAAYLVAMAPGSFNDTTVTLSALGNLSDDSYLARLDYSLTVLTYLRFNAYGAYHFGQIGELRFRYELPPSPVDLTTLNLGLDPDTQALLQGGLVIPAPVFEVGAAFTLAF